MLKSSKSKSRAHQPTPAEARPSRPAPKGKLGAVVELLHRPQGATIQTLAEATGWQDHSVRGAIAGAVKKGLGLKVISEKTDEGRVYRIPGAAE